MRTIVEKPLSDLFQELEQLGSETFEVSDYTEVDIHLSPVAAATSCCGSTSTTSTSCSSGTQSGEC
ncbi:thiazolylpeptide-type bacteriocin [Nonomuraea fuscirosea]|uniref:Thiazolylpeptide-type bacteriocin n=2 Tax=Nonomuraea TaxID=83681 RepID=A0A2T0MQZ0_9ACTN|nr:thiazolylpeptide-type bacteriocin [Nonomuraea fuscirosea]PRX60671.1 thiazolylpeptide-type bacteriocin precursor [Nonomuraea fuscirosea]